MKNFSDQTALKISNILSSVCYNISESECTSIIEALNEQAEILLDKHISDEEMSHIACRKGCGTCCSLNVAVLMPEAIVIFRHIKENIPKEKQKIIFEKLKSIAIRTKWLEDEDRIFLKQPCAFLNETGSCIIHKVRPFICRSITSIDRNHCKEALNPGLFDVGTGIISNTKQKYLYDILFTEVADYLQSNGLEDKSFEISQIISAIAENEQIIDMFFNKEKISI